MVAGFPVLAGVPVIVTEQDVRDRRKRRAVVAAGAAGAAGGAGGSWIAARGDGGATIAVENRLATLEAKMDLVIDLVKEQRGKVATRRDAFR